MDNPEKLATQDTQDTEQINVREYRRGNQKWTIQRNVNIERKSRRKTKQKHNTIYAGHHYAQTSTNNVNKT